MRLSRRRFLSAGAAIGGGLAVGFYLPGKGQAATAKKVFAPNAWIRVTPDDRVQFVLDKVEMGQGVRTSHAMLVAEELFVAPEKIECLFAEASRAYDNPFIGVQATGGSTSVMTSWVPLRTAAATAREMLIAAAARKWSVPPSECRAEEGAVLHPAHGALRYGALAESAAVSDPPSVKLRTTNFRVIGTPLDRLDARPKVNGSAVYGIDVKVPGMLIGVVVRSPVTGGQAKSFQDAAAKAVPGVQAVLAIPSGVAVVASRHWQAMRAAKLLEIEWDEGPLANDDSPQMYARYRQALKTETGKRVRSDGDLAAGFAAAAKVLEAEYTAPFVAHATMEPMNATASVRDGRCELWSGSQTSGGCLEIARRVTGLSPDKITVHQTWAGGGFGRRGHPDFIEEAVRLSMAVKAPVKVIWSRSEDLQHDYYRPMAVNAMRAGLSADGAVTAWHHRTANQSILSQIGRDLMTAILPQPLPAGIKGWVGGRAGHLFDQTLVDFSSVEGADSIPYELPNVAVDYVHQEPGIRVGFWRSVGHSHHAFVVESFIDELAHAAGKDPFEFRRALLTKKHRNRWVLEKVARESGWGTPAPEGVFRGIAQHFSFNSYAAAVAEVSVEETTIHVKRVVLAIDCGLAVNPAILKAQLESAAIYGLSAALKHEITVTQGRVVQTNFHDFELLRLHEAPKIEAHVIESQAAPTGAGEPGVPVIAPAVANAVFAATGKRLRSLPLRLT